MVRLRSFIITGLLLLGLIPSAFAQVEQDSFTYERSDCPGRCAEYVLELKADGKMTFNGRHFTILSGVHELDYDPSILKQIAKKLRTIKLIDFENEECVERLDDKAHINIAQVRKGRNSYLYHYEGCKGFAGEKDFLLLMQEIKDLLPLDGLVE